MSRLSREAKLEQERIDEIVAFVELCFDVLQNENGDCRKEICNKTGLSMSTINRLAIGDISSCVRMGTIQKMAKAAGLKLITKSKVREHAKSSG